MKSFKTRSFDANDTSFHSEGVIAFTGTNDNYLDPAGRGYFTHFKTNADAIDVVGDMFINKNDGGDINKNGDQVY